MKEYGYSIVKVLISDIVPDQKVKAAMNDINAAQREREATVSRAETNKLLLVKQAEAEAESKRLQGEGIANQRKAIISGLKDSVEDFAKTVPGSTPQDVMQLVLMTQYFDTLKDIAANDHSNTVLIPHTPNTLDRPFWTASQCDCHRIGAVEEGGARARASRGEWRRRPLRQIFHTSFVFTRVETIPLV